MKPTNPNPSKTDGPEPRFTEKQGQYLAFIDSYTALHGVSPGETDMQCFFRVSPPTVHQMVLRLEEKGLISRVPRQARSIRVLVDPACLPRLIRASSRW